ncbi:MAG TPA: M48 family metalloprotease, partial [Burkholderiales bacterium]
MLVGYVGVFFGKLIRAAISREREYLADAAAVQFTRNPDGVAGALKKIGIHSAGSRVHDPHAEEVSHLFFAHGLRSHWLGFMATHPPLEERIRRVDPKWDGLLIPPVREPGAPSPAVMAGPAARGGTSTTARAGSTLHPG